MTRPCCATPAAGASHLARLRFGRLARLSLGLLLAGLTCPAFAAETAYPFEGSWVRADRICSAASPHARTYSHREVASPSDRCMFRRVEFGSGEYELDEECRRPDRRRITERIRMLGPDAMLVRRQIVRLKIPRGHRFVRCTIAASPPSAPAPAPKAPALSTAPAH